MPKPELPEPKIAYLCFNTYLVTFFSYKYACKDILPDSHKILSSVKHAILAQPSTYRNRKQWCNKLISVDTWLLKGASKMATESYMRRIPEILLQRTWEKGENGNWNLKFVPRIPVTRAIARGIWLGDIHILDLVACPESRHIPFFFNYICCKKWIEYYLIAISKREYGGIPRFPLEMHRSRLWTPSK